jgi:uncharacterized protein (DUF2267 family)
MHPGYTDDAMNTLLTQVQHEGGIETRIDADQATRAVLATLAEAISAGQMQALGAGLPAPLSSEIARATGHARALGRVEFLERVGGEIHTVDPEIVESRTRAVTTVLGVWAPAGEIANTCAQLPGDLAELFPTPTGEK